VDPWRGRGRGRRRRGRGRGRGEGCGDVAGVERGGDRCDVGGGRGRAEEVRTVFSRKPNPPSFLQVDFLVLRPDLPPTDDEGRGKGSRAEGREEGGGGSGS
jgi:hypothetical protein